MANKPVDKKQTKKTTKKAVEIKETKEAKTTKKVNTTDKKEDKKVETKVKKGADRAKLQARPKKNIVISKKPIKMVKQNVQLQPKKVQEEPAKQIRAIKANKKSNLGLKKKYNDIEDLKNDLLNLNNQGVDIVQGDVVNALDRFDMNDDEVDQFYDWLNSVNIELIDESEDDDLEDDDYLSSELDDEDDEKNEDSEKNIVVNYEQASAYTKVNDPVKMYLKEIGRVNLLNADQEVVIAKRTANNKGKILPNTQMDYPLKQLKVGIQQSTTVEEVYQKSIKIKF